MTAKKPGSIKRAAGVWPNIVLPHAADIVTSYTTGVTLRQLFYRLVADGTIRNTQSEYVMLSRLTAEGRVAGTFPDLIDTRHDIERPLRFADPTAALDWLANVYNRDNTEGQSHSIYIGNEKMGQSAQLRSWFRDRGIPVLTIGGWASTSFVQQVQRDIEDQDRPAVLIYAGDFDPSGAYIGDDFARRVGLFDKVVRVGVNLDQISGLDFNPTPAKTANDPRVPQFIRDYGPQLVNLGFSAVVQFELDAFAPNDLRALYEAEVANWWDDDAHDASLTQQADDIAQLKEMTA